MIRFSLRFLIGVMSAVALWLGGYIHRGGDLDQMHELGRLDGIAESQDWDESCTETVRRWQRDGYLKLPD